MSKWQFDSIGSRTTEGWYSGGLTQFRDRILKNLVREILQNSLDNPAEKGQLDPVIVNFKELNLPSGEVPGIEDLREHLRMCVRDSNRSAKQHRRDIKQSSDYAESSDIRCLVIEDFNTSGMSGGKPGPCEEDSPFFNYLKTEGESGGDEDRGGSHGLGKNAPLIASRLRAIFASSCWQEEGETKELIQGRCQLMTRNNERSPGQKFVPRGYWGNDGFEPLVKCPPEYSWLARNGDIGTTIAILGWVPEKNWEKLIIGYALTSFFAAIKRGKLHIGIGSYTLSQDTLDEHMNNTSIREAYIRHHPDNEEEWDLASWLIECLEENDDVSELSFQCVGRVGNSTLRLIVREGAPKKIAFIRANILITDQIPGFWKRVPGDLKNFVGVFECTNEGGTQFLRNMEPPQHNSLDPDFLPPDERDSGRAGLRNLSEQLKRLVSEKAQISDGEKFADIATLEFFADEAGDGEDIQDDADIDPEGGLIIHVRPRPAPPPKKIITDDDIRAEEDVSISEDEPGELGGAGPGGGSGGGDGPGDGPGEGPGTGGTGNKGLDKEILSGAIAVQGERFIKTSASGGRVNFKCVIKGSDKIEVALFEVGADTTSYIPSDEIKESTNAIGRKGLILDGSAAGGRYEFSFELSRPLLGGLMLVANMVDRNEV